MGAAQRRTLTKRQKAVIERIDRRVPIKVIAQDLDVSETRINQHIRALKDFYQVESLNELVECYRHEFGSETDEPSMQEAHGEVGLSESAYRKNQLVVASSGEPDQARVDPGEIVLSDVLPLGGLAPWKLENEPKVVPGMLDGDNAIVFRLVAMIGIAFGFLAVVVLTITAAITISEALDGRATIPVDEQGFS